MKKDNKKYIVWLLPVVAMVLFAYLGGTFQDISTPFSDTIIYDEFDSGIDSSNWKLVGSDLDRDWGNIETINGFLTGDVNCKVRNKDGICIEAFDAGLESVQDFKDLYVKIRASGTGGIICFGEFNSYGALGRCAPVGGETINPSNSQRTRYSTDVLMEILPSNLRSGEGWIFVDGKEFANFTSLSSYKVYFKFPLHEKAWSLKVSSVRYSVPWGCHIGQDQGFIRQTYNANDVIAINTLAKSPRKFCLSQPARILRDNNLIPDAEIYDRISKGGSYTVASNERIDIFYIYDQFDCGFNEYYDYSSKQCVPLEQLQLTCTNGEFNENLNSCTVEPEIEEIIVEVPGETSTETIIQVVTETICPDGYTKEFYNGKETCVTSNPDVVQISEENANNISALGLSTKKLGLLGFMAATLLLLIIYYFTGRRGKKK